MPLTLAQLHFSSSYRLLSADYAKMTAEPLEQVKLLTALRSGDPALIHPFLSEISRDSKESHTNADLNAGAAALHLAIRCASLDTIAILLAHRAIDPNGVHPPGSGTTPLHLAASLGRGDVVRLLLDQGDIDDTRLDAYGRNCRDLVKGKDVAKIIDDSRAFLNASYRSLLRSYILSDTNAPALASSTSVTSPPNSNPTPNAQLASFLSSPRARHPYLEINYIEDSSGLSLLHAAASRHDIRMIELAIRSGADVFVRDARGRGVEDVVNSRHNVHRAGHSGDTLSKGSNKEWKTEGDRIKVFLRQLANQDATLLQSTSRLSSSLSKQQLDVSNRAYSRPTPSEAPSLKGYLNKYANVAKGYNTRWFVLRDGVLSYYRHQDDETIASRGSISMKNAMLKVSPGDSREKLRFEVHSNPSAASHSGTPAQRWYMKASHPVEAARWVQALSRTIEWWHTQEREDASSMSGISASPSRVNVLANEDARSRHSGDSDRSRTSILRKKVGGFGASSHTLVKGSDSDGSFVDVTRGEGSKHLSVASNMSSKSGGASSTDVSTKDRETPATQGDETDAGSYRSHVDENSSYHRNDDDDSVLNGDDSFADDSSSGNTGRRGPPYADSFDLQANTLSAQMEILVSALSKVANSPSTSSEMPKFVQSLAAMQSLQNDYISMVQAREEWYSRELKKEQKRQTVWEESLKVVVKEGEVLEQELRRRARRKGAGGGRESKMLEFGVGSSQADTLGNSTIRARASRLFENVGTSSVSETAGGTVKGKKAFVELPPTDIPQEEQESQAGPAELTSPPLTERTTSPRTPTGKLPLPRSFSGGAIPTNASSPSARNEDEDDMDTDEEDEFFDAIEANAIPNLVIPGALASPPPTQQVLLANSNEEKTDEVIESLRPMAQSMGLIFDVAQYAGYAHLRTRLALDADNRPSTSLWSVLKHSIGKDLTKISFPVFFNEPTSMLQRMAEDMEFSECLDIAAAETDVHKRLAFVAAFAMSNYSSTIGRIAKPFNPMLSETFELVRLDKEYRYVSEQVSHHPPMSACWAESPKWHYFGEVDAQNKFMGKSFEIRPTGIAHAELLLPESFAPHYPKAKGKVGEGKVVEHYTWKKVTTNVSGFILGSPTIDHYGDMIVTNHRTGDQCILTFKPRGWRGKDAYEISGLVRDASGNVTYEIAGRWNSQLVARRAGDGSGFLNPDTSVNDDDALSPSIPQEYILLWRNSEKPTAPFNLTPFAITLNDCPDTLRPYICPTDCRLRPDQRAFENGKYELANDLKNQQEEKQRATRRAREEGRLPPHKPRWFTAETDGDTGERVWTPSRIGDSLEYWIEREKVWRAEAKIGWKDVDPIFVETDM